MIKAKVVSFRLSRTNGSLSKLELETYLEDQVDINSFCMGVDFDGLDAVIMTEEEYKALEEVNKALDAVSDTLRNDLLDEREKTEQLEKTIKRLKERLAQEAAEVDIHPDGTIVFKKKRVSELEKEVEKLKEENKYLKRRLLTRYTVKLDADGAIIYPELKED